MFLTVADKHAPVITRRVRERSVAWLTPEIKKLMHEQEYHHKQLNNYIGTPINNYKTRLP